jgi:predicted ABC-type transport system involved in lysophospholipase L1 biosynthesis ATPase subunit
MLRTLVLMSKVATGAAVILVAHDSGVAARADRARVTP